MNKLDQIGSNHATYSPLVIFARPNYIHRPINQTSSYMHISNHNSLIHPSHTLGNQELIQPLLRIKATPTAVLDTSMGQNRLIVDSHAIDMDSPARISIVTAYSKTAKKEEKG